METPKSTCQLFNGDCLEIMHELEDDSIDLIFCDLPYGQTHCKWDSLIDLEKFWEQVMRIKKINTPIIMTTTTKFGSSLISTAPKKCPFRYDLIWVKSAPCGHLNARRMPMRKHEMVYVFYEKLPFYDLSSHVVVSSKESKSKRDKNSVYGNSCKIEKASKYEPPIPNSIIKNDIEVDSKTGATMVKGTLGGLYGAKWQKNHKGNSYQPPIPNSIIKEEEDKPVIKGINNTYNTEGRKKPITREKPGKYNPQLPVSVLKEDNKYIPPGARYYEDLPDSMVEIKSTAGKHSTEKPVALMSWVLKYYSKEGDTILDPTMGSGSTGVSCENMNRNFIGIEKDEVIFKGAEERLKNNIS